MNGEIAMTSTTNTIDIKKYALDFKRSRANLLGVVAFTLINLFLIIIDADLYFLFSASIPMFILWIFEGVYIESGILGLRIFGIVLAFIGTGAYLLFWGLSKKFRAWILVALIVFAFDSLIMLLVFLLAGFDAGAFIDIAFSAWVLYYLIVGTRAWSNLRNVSHEELQAVTAAAEQENVETETAEALSEIAPDNNTNVTTSVDSSTDTDSATRTYDEYRSHDSYSTDNRDGE